MSKSSWHMSEQLNQVQMKSLNYSFVSSMITWFLNHCFWDGLLYSIIGALKKLIYRGYKRVILLGIGKGIGKRISLKKTMLCDPTISAHSGGKDGLSPHLKPTDRGLLEIII